MSKYAYGEKARSSCCSSLTAVTDRKSPAAAVDSHNNMDQMPPPMTSGQNCHEEHQQLQQQQQQDRPETMMMMQMYFYASNKATILFKEWNTDTDWEIVGSSVAVVLLGVIYESIKFYKEMLRTQQHQRDYLSASGGNDDNNGDGPVLPGARFMCTDFLSRGHILLTILHFIQLSLSYVLMLVAMTFNVWLFLAVVTGSSLGFFLFGWKHPPSLAAAGDHC